MILANCFRDLALNLRQIKYGRGAQHNVPVSHLDRGWPCSAPQARRAR